MSVRKCDRNEGKLQVLNLSLNLAVYTLQICHNEKVFPKSQRWIMTQRIVNECLDAVTCIRRANAVLVQDEQGRMPTGTTRDSLQAFLANAARGNAYRQCAKIKQYYKDLTGRDYE